MCGIFAILHDEPAKAAPQAVLRALRHRGPDASALWQAPGCLLAHTRLAIVAPDHGAQPLVHPPTGVALVVNGEFYDHRSIRADLQARGAHFQTDSDSEILLHLYLMDGPELAISKLNGEFAFVLWDPRAHHLWAGRDRFGIKPLVWTRLGPRSWALASEVKALQAYGVPMRWDLKALAKSCHHQYIDPQDTLFDGIFTLPPGHTLSLCAGKPPKSSPYWSVDHIPPAAPSPTPEEGIKAVRELLGSAVRRRLQGDVPVTATLSGGLDSSFVAALAAQAGGITESFGVGFAGADPRYDESHWATEVAQHLGLKHHCVRLTPRDLVDALEPAVRGAEGLCINAHLPAKFLLAQAIHQAGYKVVLTGEGADELFLGYPHLEQDVGSSAWRPADSTVAGVMVASGQEQGYDTGSLQQALGFVPAWVRAKVQLGWRLRPFVQTRWHQTLGSIGLDIDAATPIPPERPRVRTSAALWTRFALAGYILRSLGDGTEMPHSLEGRTPFLDHTLWEGTWGLDPQGFCFGEGREKWVLRQAAQGLLPQTILARKKHPFLAPSISAALAPRLRELVGDLALGESSDFGWWDRRAVLAMVDRLPGLSATELQLLEPVVMTIASSFLLHTSFSMEFAP